jgi:hypothetical protein
MMNMDKRYMYQNFNDVAYKKTYKNEYFVHIKTSKIVKKGLIAFITSMHIIICRRRISTSKGLRNSNPLHRKKSSFCNLS